MRILENHVSVFIPDGIGRDVQANLDRITRLWAERKQRADDEHAVSFPTARRHSGP